MSSASISYTEFLGFLVTRSFRVSSANIRHRQYDMTLAKPLGVHGALDVNKEYQEKRRRKNRSVLVPSSVLPPSSKAKSPLAPSSKARSP